MKVYNDLRLAADNEQVSALCLLDSADLADFVGKRQVNFRSFADDSQTYMHCLLGDVGSRSVNSRVAFRSLKLNADKTELVPGIT